MPDYDYGEFSQQLTELGFDEGYSPFSSSDIASALGSQLEIEIQPGQLGALTPQMFQAANLQTYQPIAELKQQSMLGQLAKGLEGTQMRKAMGGFGASGGTAQQEQASRDVYGKSSADVMKEISGLQQQGRRGVLDVINSWRNLMASLGGGSSTAGGPGIGGQGQSQV